MARRRPRIEYREPEGWEAFESFHQEGLARMERGSEVTVRGLGRCRFLRVVLAPSGAWADVAWPRTGAVRSVPLDRIRTVHRTRRLPARLVPKV